MVQDVALFKVDYWKLRGINMGAFIGVFGILMGAIMVLVLKAFGG